MALREDPFVRERGAYSPGAGEADHGEGIPLGLGVLFYLGVAGLGVGLPLVFGRWEEAAALARGREGFFFQAGLGAGVGLLLVGLSRVLTAQLKIMKELEAALASLVGAIGPGRALALAIVSGVAEEWFFRCAFLDLVGPYWSTLVFALVHTGPGKKFRAWTLLAGLAGALFAWMILQGWGLAGVAAAHAVLNFLNLMRLGAGNKNKRFTP